MSTTNNRVRCFSCNKETRTLNSGGCLEDFCLNCFTNHRQMLSKELDEFEHFHDELRQTIYDQKDNPKNHLLAQQIDQWETDSINKIKRAAEECRQTLADYTEKYMVEIENKLNNIGKQLRKVRQENDFNEIDLEQFKETLNALKKELGNPSNVSIKQQSLFFIEKIFVNITFKEDDDEELFQSTRPPIQDPVLQPTTTPKYKFNQNIPSVLNPDDSDDELFK